MGLEVKRKLLTVLVMFGLTSALLVGCGAKAAPTSDTKSVTTTPDTTKKKVIGISVSGFSAPYFKALISAAQEEGKKQNVELKILDGETGKSSRKSYSSKG